MKKLLFFTIGFLAVVANADPLTSCTNIGGAAYQTTPPSYSINGDTYNICSGCPDGETIADVNALVGLGPGDAVLFKAGETFTISNEANRLDAVGGVLYGRYGSGANPLINGSAGLTFSVGFRGLFEADGVNNVTVDGIDFDNSPSFGLMFRDSNDSSLSNSTVTNMEGCAVCFIRALRPVVDKNVINSNPAGPHEALTFTNNVTDYVASNNRICGNDHASINNKNNVARGEIFGNELCQESNDPTLYCTDGCVDLKVHDNWVHTAIGNYKGLVVLGAEQPGDGARNNEYWNNVIHTTNKHGIRFWLRATVDCPTAGADQKVHNNWIHHNTIYDTGNSGTTFDHAVVSVDLRDGISNDGGVGCGIDPDDWSDNLIENNIIWSTNSSDGIHHADGTQVGFTSRYNLFETGETGGSDLGTNTITTGTAPFVDLANLDFDPAGAAIGAGSDGSNVGATINWTCGLGTNPDPEPDPLTSITTAKPDPYQIDALETHYPDHLWVMTSLTGGTTMEDEGGGTACDLTNNGADTATDEFGASFTFVSSQADYMQGSCADPPTTTGVMCVIFRDSTFGATNQTAVSWGDADDTIMTAAISAQAASGNVIAGLCETGTCGSNNNTGPWSMMDGNVNMACVRQSTTQNDVWLNDSGWQTLTVDASGFSWAAIDQFTIGALGRSVISEHIGGKIYAAFTYDGSKTDAEMSTIYNDSGSGGNPWAQIGIDPASTPPNEVTSRGDYPSPAN